MDHIEAPALLAYKDGDVFATIVEILRQIPKGRSCSADSLEDLLRSYVISLYIFLTNVQITNQPNRYRIL